MSLYGDLPAAQTGQEPAASLWSAEPPPPAAPAKKATVLAPLSVLRKAATPAERPRQAKPSVAAAQALAQTPAPAEPVAPAAGQSLIADVEDEYNPAQPNSYEDVLRARALQQKQAELAEKRKALERHRVELLEARRRAEAAAQLQQQAYAQLPLPPPPPLPPGMQLPPPPPLPPAVDEEMADDSSAPDGKTAAQRMMERMGWREGQGLGKAGDGMKSCLVVKKTDARAGVIVNAPAPRLAPQPTCVLCLRGMVGPGQVDDALEDEVAEECEKCVGGPGSVVQVLIFEATDAGIAPHLAVRIFVQFTSIEAAVKARAEMDGRFFGGRQISAAFYDEGRFEAQDLAPCAGEFDT
jgi:splicing factor 45